MTEKLHRKSSSVDPHHDKHGEHKHQLGVLLTGHLQKQNPYGKAYRTRFVVLTQEAFHWFKKQENDHLFGEERGQVSLKSIETVRILDEDPTQFELLSENFTRRYFKCRDDVECEEWVSAIRSAVKMISIEKKQKRKSVYNAEGQKFVDPTEEASTDTTEVKVILVSHVSSADGIETVIARNPGWGRLIFLSNIRSGDSIVISTSNGGSITLPSVTLQDKAGRGAAFDTAIQNVLLASSLRTLVVEEPHTLEQSNAQMATKQTLLTQIIENLKEISQNQRSVEILTISLMVLVAASKALVSLVSPTVESSMSLFVALAVVLAGNSSIQTLSSIGGGVGKSARVRASAASSHTSENFHLTIIEHQYTSPDAPVKAPEDEIPERFLNGCDGDIREARRRWDITRKWREENNIDNILNEEQPHFNNIKTLYPHYLCGKGKEGNFVYYERPGEIEIPQLNARGIHIDEMLRHWLFVTEYQYNIVVPGELDKCITVIDIEQVKMSDMAGDALDFVRKSVGIANQHYPERAFIIFLINVPSWFSFIWRIVKPLVHENTQKKVKILSKKEVLSGLLEHIDMDQIPVYYGGGMGSGGNDSARFDSEIEANMREYVRRLNARCRGEPIEENEEPSTSPAPLEEAEEDDNSSVVHEGPGGGDLPPGAPGDMSRVSGLQRRNSLKVMRALEGGEDDDDKEYGGPLPKLSARISNMSELSMAGGMEIGENGPQNAYRTEAPPRTFTAPITASDHKSIRRASHTADDWSVSSIGNSVATGPSRPVSNSSATRLFPSTR